MIKHVVVWKLKEENLEANKAKFKAMLLGLKGLIPELIDAEVGMKESASPENNDDIVLISTVDSWAGLDAYQIHPEHQKVIAFAKEVVTKRSAVDYEV